MAYTHCLFMVAETCFLRAIEECYTSETTSHTKSVPRLIHVLCTLVWVRVRSESAEIRQAASCVCVCVCVSVYVCLGEAALRPAYSAWHSKAQAKQALHTAQAKTKHMNTLYDRHLGNAMRMNRRHVVIPCSIPNQLCHLPNPPYWNECPIRIQSAYKVTKLQHKPMHGFNLCAPYYFTQSSVTLPIPP